MDETLPSKNLCIESLSNGLLETIRDLEFISKIEENQKPLYNTKNTIAKNAWFVTIRRRFAEEKGEKGIIHVNRVLDSCDLYYRMCLSDKNNMLLPNLLSNLSLLKLSLESSVPGFNNLINTYSDQEKVCKDYKLCKERVIDLYQCIDKYLEASHKYINKKKIPKTEKIEKLENIKTKECASFFTSTNMTIKKN